MAIKRHKPEEIVSKLRQVEVLVGEGMARLDAIRQVRITEQTFYRWRTTRQPRKPSFRCIPGRSCINIQIGPFNGGRPGQRVDVLSLAADPLQRSPEGLEWVGPRAFGYDLEYVSLHD